jgi:hypothetical protein
VWNASENERSEQEQQQGQKQEQQHEQEGEEAAGRSSGRQSRQPRHSASVQCRTAVAQGVVVIGSLTVPGRVPVP